MNELVAPLPGLKLVELYSPDRTLVPRIHKGKSVTFPIGAFPQKTTQIELLANEISYFAIRILVDSALLVFAAAEVGLHRSDTQSVNLTDQPLIAVIGPHALDLKTLEIEEALVMLQRLFLAAPLPAEVKCVIDFSTKARDNVRVIAGGLAGGAIGGALMGALESLEAVGRETSVEKEINRGEFLSHSAQEVLFNLVQIDGWLCMVNGKKVSVAMPK